MEDYVGGAPFFDVGANQDQGRLYVFSTTGACPASRILPAGFADIAGNIHVQAINCVGFYEIALGTTATTYAPSDPVRRDQMASFVARTLETGGGDLPEPSDQGFADVDANTHEAAINQLAELGIVQGVAADRYAPANAVRRDQMASFLVRAYEHLTGEQLPQGDPPFTDTQGNTHETNINKAYAAGFTLGTSDTTYAPADPVRRDQMAAFITRMLERVAADRSLVGPARR